MPLSRLSRRGGINEQKVMRLISENGPATRAEVIGQLNRSAPIVSKAVISLMEAGLLEEVIETENVVGRPARKLRLASESSQVLGIVVSPGTSWVVASGLDGNVDEGRTRKVRTPEKYEDLIDALVEHAQDMMDRPGVRTLGAGVCFPGLVDVERGLTLMCVNMPVLVGRFPPLDLSDRLGIECVPLFSRHALCLAERFHGEARNLDDFAIVDFSIGAALGIVTRGEFLRGKNGFAGELGHITVAPEGPLCGCGNRGCLQSLTTNDAALAASASRRLGRYVDVDELVALCRGNLLNLDDEIKEFIRYSSIALATVINILNPTTLFLHGRVFELRDDVFPALLEAIAQRALGAGFRECRIVPASGNKRQGAVAAVIQSVIDSLAPERFSSSR